MSDEWTSSLLGEIAEVIGGGTPSTKVPEYWNGSIPWLTPTEVVKADGQRIATSERMISQAGLENSSAKLLPKDAVLLTTRASVGFVALSDAPVATNQGFQSLIPKGSLLSEYLMYWIQGNRDEFTSRAGGSTFPEISKSKVLTIPITFPSLPVQRRIVDLMTHLDNHIETLSREIATVNDCLAALTTQLIFGRESESWERSTIGAEFDVRDGTHDSPKYVDDGFPLLTSKNLASGRLVCDGASLISREDFDSINVRSGVDSGELLMAMIGTIGNVCIVDSEPDFAVKNVALFKRGQRMRRRFLYFYLLSREVREQMLLEAKGSTQKFVSLGYLRTFCIRVPPPEMEERAINILSQCLHTEKALEFERERIVRVRTACLTSLLRGEIALDESLDAIPKEAV